MAQARYSREAAPEIECLVADLFALGGVGYVAIGRGQDVLMRRHPKLVTGTTEESNFYEELILNPSLLKLAGQRGDLDCGGLRFIAIGYGEFIEMIMRMKDGHISLGVSSKTQVDEFAAKMQGVLEDHGLEHRGPEISLFSAADLAAARA
jgi:hypothetical protein